jgi:hypothetical protein
MTANMQIDVDGPEVLGAEVQPDVPLALLDLRNHARGYRLAQALGEVAGAISGLLAKIDQISRSRPPHLGLVKRGVRDQSAYRAVSGLRLGDDVGRTEHLAVDTGLLSLSINLIESA